MFLGFFFRYTQYCELKHSFLFQTGEYFGFSLVTADLNGNGLDELLVGSPMYTLPNKPDVGRVLVYNNVAVSSAAVCRGSLDTN